MAIYLREGRFRVMTGAVGIVLLAAACGDSTPAGTGAAAPAQTHASAPPMSSEAPAGVLAIGHSGLTGESSDPARIGQDAPENSWATGTAVEVDSVYQRLVAARPETEGHVANFARGGARAFALTGQAASGLDKLPNPALVIVQTIDNDIRCDGADAAAVPLFGRQLADALTIITDRAPEAKILIVGQIGRPAIAVKAFAQLPAAKAGLTGTGVCDMFDPAGGIAPAKVAALTDVIQGYEAEQARVCATVPGCSTDEGVLGSFVDRPEYFAAGHLTTPALAEVAALIWPTVEELLP